MGQGQFSAADVQTTPQPMGQFSAADVQAAPAAPPSAWDKAAHFAGEFWDQVNPVKGVQGLAQLTSNPIESLKNDAGARQALLDKAKASFKNGDYAEGVAHGIYSMIPFAGPNMDRSGEQFKSGDVAGGVGSTLGQAAAIVAPELVKGVSVKLPTGDLAESMYQKALKPPVNTSQAKVGRMVSTGLDNAIPISSAGVEKLGSLIDDVNAKIADEIKADPTRPINKFAVASRLSDTAKKFATQVNPGDDLEAISKSGNEFLQNQPANINASDAQALKQGTYAQLKGKAYGELKSASIEAQKALARGLKEELNSAFPELQNLNAADSKLYDLQPVLEKAVMRSENRDLLGLGAPVAGTAAKVVSGSGKLGASVTLLKAIVDNPAVKSRIAIALSKASQGKLTLPMAAARLSQYASALGNAATSQPVSDQQDQQAN